MATSALFSYPTAAAFDPSGNLYVADASGGRVRLITPTGAVSTIAGGGPTACANGVGSNAQFQSLRGLTVDPTGTILYAADYFCCTIKKIVLATRAVTTFAGIPGYTSTPSQACVFASKIDGPALGPGTGLSNPCNLVTDPAGNLYVAGGADNKVRKVSPGGGGWLTTLAGTGVAGSATGTGTNALFSWANGIAIDASGNLYVSGANNDLLNKLAPPPALTSAISSPVCDNSWHHVAASFDGLSAAMYVDGALVFNGLSTALTATSLAFSTANGLAAQLTIGGFNGSGALEPFSGAFSDVRVFARNISAAEALLLSQPPMLVFPGATMSPPGPVPFATSYSWACSGGFAGGPAIALTQSSADKSWSWGTNGSSISCLQCAAGQFAAPNSASCSPCPSGSVAPGAGSSFCTACPPGSYAASATACASCVPASTYSFGGGATSTCAACAAGATFVAPSLGCVPSATLDSGPTGAAPQGPVLFFSGSSVENLGGFSAINPAGISFAGSDRLGNVGGAMTLAQGSYLVSAPLPQLPTANGAISVSVFAKCAPPTTAAGRVLIDLSAGPNAPAGTERQTLYALPTQAAAAINNVQYSLTTLAGGTSASFADGTGTAALFNVPYGLAVDAAFNVYVADHSNHRIRRVTQAGVVTTVIGTGVAGSTDGVGTNALVNTPYDVTLDPSGTYLAICDSGSNKLRKYVIATQVTSVIAGCGPSTACAGADADGTGTNAKFNYPVSAVFDVSLNLWVLESSGTKVRLVTPLGVVTTIAGAGSGFADGLGTNALFSSPRALAIDPASAFVYVADYSNARLRRISTSPPYAVTTLVGNGVVGRLDGQGTNAQLYQPSGVLVDPQGMIYLADGGGNKLRKISPNGTCVSIVGSGASSYTSGVGTNAGFLFAYGLAMDSTGVIYECDANGGVRRIVPPSPMASAFSAGICDGSTWHHVAYVYDGFGSAQLFVDGSLAGTTLGASGAVTFFDAAHGAPPVLSIGGYAGAAEMFQGSLSNLRIYSRNISAAEVLALSQPPLPTVSALAVMTPPAPTALATAYSWSCAAGYAGNTLSITRSSADGSWSPLVGILSCTQCAAGWAAAPGATSCTQCLYGYYSASAGAVSCTACPAGMFAPVPLGATTCVSCPSNTYTFGASALGCASCGPGEGFIGATVGCSPSNSSDSGPTDTVLFFAGSEVDGVSDFDEIGPGSFSYVADRLSRPAGALSIPFGNSLSTGVDPVLPTGLGARAFSAFVKCPAPSSASGRVILDLGGDPGAKGTAAALTEHLTILGLATTAAPSFKTLDYTTSTIAGSGTSALFADGVGTLAAFQKPQYMALDPVSNLYVADTSNNRIRLVARSGIVSTFAGGAVAGALEGVGTNSQFNSPYGLALSNDGTWLAVFDSNNNKVRKIVLATALSSTYVGCLVGQCSGSDADGVGSELTLPEPDPT